MKSHMGIKDYVCSDCGKAFTEKRYRESERMGETNRSKKERSVDVRQ